jgi:hypothetical protein
MYRLFLLLSLLYVLPLQAQEEGPARPRFEVYESSREFSAGPANALVIELPGVSEKMADKVWKDYLGKFGGKTKRMKEIKGYATTGTEIYAVAGYEKINLYSRLEDNRSRSALTVWFEKPSGMLRSDIDPRGYKEAVNFLQDYGMQVHIAQVEEELGNEEKQLKQLERDLDRLKKDQAGFEKDIESARERIARAEKQIAENQQQQVQSAERIGQQQEKVRAVQERIRQLRR